MTSESSSTTSPVTSSTPLFSISNLSPHNISQYVPLKLKKDNFTMWKTLFLPVLRSFKIAHLVDESHKPPPPTIAKLDSTGKSVDVTNPAYTEWIDQDQLLLILFNATMSEEILPYVVGFSFAKELWLSLQHRFASITRSHALQLKARLQNLKKETNPITTYLQEIKTITDSLAAAGNPLNDLDIVFHILNGLPPEYDSFCTSVRVRENPVTSDNLHSLLLSEEINISRRLSSSISPDQITQAFAVMNPHYSSNTHRGSSPKSRGNYRGRGRGRSNFRPPNYNNHYNQNPIHHLTSNPQQTYPTNFSPIPHSSTTPYPLSQNQSLIQPRPPCQICGKPNHSALDCYHRMNFAYYGKQPPEKLQAMAATYNSPSFSPNSLLFTPPPHSPSPNWIFDTGASSHITNDAQNLETPYSYYGPEQVHTANGEGQYNWSYSPSRPT